jgi:hypothetical protein
LLLGERQVGEGRYAVTVLVEEVGLQRVGGVLEVMGELEGLSDVIDPHYTRLQLLEYLMAITDEHGCEGLKHAIAIFPGEWQLGIVIP